MTFYPLRSFQGRELLPVRIEAEIPDAEVEGDIPRELNGVLYRVGGDRYYPTLEGDTVINGDGLISFFRFENGHVDFKSRYVQTDRHLAERAARRRLYGKYRNKYTDDPAAPQVNRDNTANTHAFWHGGRLLALREDSHPYEIDPITLETRDIYHYGGKLRSVSVSAHPKIDPDTGEAWNFGLFASGEPYDGTLSLQVADRHGELIREEWFQAPFPGLQHDWAVTEDYVIFANLPVTADFERIKAGGDFYAYDPSLPTAWGIFPRHGSPSDIRWFDVPRSVIGHTMNAYNEGDKVYVDAAVSPGNSFTMFSDLNGNATPVEEGNAIWTRLSFDLGRDDGDVTRTVFEDSWGEMPRVDPRYLTKRYRYGFSRGVNGIQRLDWDNDTRVELTLPPGVVAQEPLFVPRSADAPEGDGFVLSMVNFIAENRAELFVLDAQKLEEGPLARVKLPYKQTFSFHGSWVPLDQLP